MNLTTACNLACTYCHAIHRRAHLGAHEIAQTAAGVGALDEVVQVVPFGGEPLVAWKALCALIEGAEREGVREFLLCTNGLLADEARLDYLARHHVEVTVSWDGVPAANDLVRVHPDGQGTGTEIEQACHRARRSTGAPLQLRITVGPETAHLFGASLRHAIDAFGGAPGVKICFMPVSTMPWTEAQLASLDEGLSEGADRLLAARRAGQRATIAYNECLRTHEMGEQVLFEDDGQRAACLWGVKMLAVDTDGGLYPCHTVVELRAEQRAHLRLGHIADGIPAAAARARRMPGAERNPWNTCFAWNLARSNDPFDIAEVYRRAFASFVTCSVRLVEALTPERGEEARQRAVKLIERQIEVERGPWRAPSTGAAGGD